MQKYADIIMYPTDDPEVRFIKLMTLIEEICLKYPCNYLMFVNGRFIVSEDVEPYYELQVSRSIIKPTVKNTSSDDKYIRYWTNEYLEKRIIKYVFKRINAVLNPIQREILVNRYMKYLVKTPKKREELIEKYSLSRKKYDSKLREIKEILYEVLDLDVVDDYGNWMSQSFVQYMREIRTGVANGYIGLHPEWNL